MRKPKPGEKVKMMDDTVVYTVAGLLPGDMVLVMTDDGLEFPVRATDLILASLAPEDLVMGSSTKKQPEKPQVIKRSGQKREETRTRTVDLHCSGILSGATGFSTIDLQLLRFRSELDAAIRDGYSEITFIHGVGSGILKSSIRKVLTDNYPSLSFHDASFRRYGYGGATRIVISKGKV